jgi:putative endopeptidase
VLLPLSFAFNSLILWKLIMRLASSLLLSLFCLCSTEVFSFFLPSFVSHRESLHLDWMDFSVDPAQNFFNFANGRWIKDHSIPNAYSHWSTFNVLEERNQGIIKTILERESTKQHATEDDKQKVGDFYFSGMDEDMINKAGSSPLQPEFDRINTITTSMDLPKVIGHLQLIGVDAPFNFGQMQDYQDSSTVIGVAAQAGLGLPDRDYYLKEDVKFQQLRKIYQEHIANMFILLGDSRELSAIEAQKVLAIETEWAKASMPRAEQRIPSNIYHLKKGLAELNKETPNFNWADYFYSLGYPDIKNVNLAMPDFFKAFNSQITTLSVDEWKIYLRWQLISEYAPYLSAPFVNENFKMNSAISGSKELLPRWKRVIAAEDQALGFAVGKLYVAKAFPDSYKKKAQQILTDIRQILNDDLGTLSWMTPQTRAAALHKLNLMEERIGYPTQSRDYSALKVVRGPYILNILHANEFLKRHEFDKIGKPVDRNEWDMTPQTVNAYYDPSTNRINIPAGILQPPFFDPKAPASVNYGAIGFIMGHEMTHGFDDEGARFDGDGNLKNWWQAQDLQEFHTRTRAIAEQFSHYKIAQMNVQGELVTGEAAADFGGLTLAYRAFHASDAYKKQAKKIAGFTPDQQFFLGAAHVWANNIRMDEARLRIITDPHPPAKYRVNGTLANMPEFQQAFNVPATSPMVNKDRLGIW